MSRQDPPKVVRVNGWSGDGSWPGSRPGVSTVGIFLVMVVIIFAGLIHHVGQMVLGTATEPVDHAKEDRLGLLGMLLVIPAVYALAMQPAPLPTAAAKEVRP